MAHRRGAFCIPGLAHRQQRRSATVHLSLDSFRRVFSGALIVLSSSVSTAPSRHLVWTNFSKQPRPHGDQRRFEQAQLTIQNHELGADCLGHRLFFAAEVGDGLVIRCQLSRQFESSGQSAATSIGRM
jgi:hypothetical protein